MSSYFSIFFGFFLYKKRPVNDRPFMKIPNLETTYFAVRVTTPFVRASPSFTMNAELTIVV